MGQYYYPINLDTFEWIYSHDFDTGLKLMEHSYIGNPFVSRIMKLLTKGQKWYKTKLIWCGDYSNKVINNEYGLSDLECEDNESKIKLFKNIKPRLRLKEDEENKAFLVNHSKKEYVNNSKLKKDGDGWLINPLPLLTSFGNGQGGGDYRGCGMNLLGSWACDVISVEFDLNELKDYTELEPEFKEGEEDGDNTENDNNTTKKIKEWLNTKEVRKKLVIEVL